MARSKLKSIESTISKALVDNETSHEDFTTVINEERNHLELKEGIRMMKSYRSAIERDKLTEDGKRIDIDEIIKQNERLKNNLKSQV